jgi:hypothetical protein
LKSIIDSADAGINDINSERTELKNVLIELTKALEEMTSRYNEYRSMLSNYLNTIPDEEQSDSMSVSESDESLTDKLRNQRQKLEPGNHPNSYDSLKAQVKSFLDQDELEINALEEGSGIADDQPGSMYGGAIMGGAMLFTRDTTTFLLVVCVLLILYIIYLICTSKPTHNRIGYSPVYPRRLYV